VITLCWNDGRGGNAAAAAPVINTQNQLPVYETRAFIPFSSRRQFREVVLNNGLRVLLVQDKQADRASAALSIDGAGQFSDPVDLPGLAHLMEHMTLSGRTSSSPFRKGGDFEEWLSDEDGASNAFTAYNMVCFHFNCPPDAFQEALKRFAGLFKREAVRKICLDDITLRREIRRVDSELDNSNEFAEALYLVKSKTNRDHPFSRFNAGSLDTLERIPKERGIHVGERLVDFFDQQYLAAKALLVVICPAEPSALERWVSGFDDTLSNRRDVADVSRLTYPKTFLGGSRMEQLVLMHSKASGTRENRGRVAMFWGLNLDYDEVEKAGTEAITATQIGFLVSQILGRRGPGSLYLFLTRRGWVPKGIKGLPQVSIPVDVSGFQLLKLEIELTLQGIRNRSAVVAAVYDAINTVLTGTTTISNVLSRELVTQYVTVAQLHGFVLAPRPRDAVELAVDGARYGLGSSRSWHLFPSTHNKEAMENLRNAIEESFELMSNPSNALVVISASNKALSNSRGTLFEDPIPPLSSSRWQMEPISGGHYYSEAMLRLPGKVEEWFAARLDEDELQPPSLNPLIPTILRPPRISSGKSFQTDLIARTLNNQVHAGEMKKVVWRQRPESIGMSNRFLSQGERGDWVLLQLDDNSMSFLSLPLPMAPPEPSCRCSVVLQLLSPRPARAKIKQVARAELWKTSFEQSLVDLVGLQRLVNFQNAFTYQLYCQAELGAPAGLYYDLSFNKFGMRICFLGISQNISSYARRFCRRLVEHQTKLLEGPEFLESDSVEAAQVLVSRAPHVSQLRKRQITSGMRDSTAFDAAVEGISFFKSCNGALFLTQGDLLPSESSLLQHELKEIFRPVIGKNGYAQSATPKILDLLYKPTWKPRSASPCAIPGMNLVSDACGRVPR
jgi:insulysin